MSTRGRSSLSTRDMKVMNEFEMEFVVNEFEMVKIKINMKMVEMKWYEFEMVKMKIVKYEDGRDENKIRDDRDENNQIVTCRQDGRDENSQ